MTFSPSAPTYRTHEHSFTGGPNRFADRMRRSLTNPLCNPGILVVDDESCIRDLLSRTLQHQGFEIWQANNGFDALDIYREHQGAIALVLLDVRMVGLDGPHTLRCLQHIDPNVRACFMSGDSGDYGEAQLLRLGALRVFWKPFALDSVAAAVRQIIRNAEETLPVGG